MKKPLSDNLKQITPSMTLSITAKAKALKDQGIEVIPFGAGEPDFTIDPIIKQAAIEGVQKDYSKYTQITGLLELRKAIAGKLLKNNGLVYQPDEIIVTSGAKQALFTSLQVLLSSGDEVLVPVPYWVSYSEMVKIAGGKVVLLPTAKEDQFILKPDELKKHISSRSKVLMLNNPNNPTGSVYSRDDLLKIVEICVQEGIYILSDEIYDRFIYDGLEHVSTASLSDEAKDITVTINGLSKTYAMPGWRIGYAAANKEIITAMSKLQGHCISHPSSISQYAAITALECEQEFVDDMLKEYNRRREYIKDYLDSLPFISYIRPKGAFYFFIDVSEYYGNCANDVLIDSSLSFSEELLKHFHVAVIPGVGFGVDKFIRLSYACSLEDIKTGLERFRIFLDTLKPRAK